MVCDKFTRLVQGAQFPVTILGNPATADFELIDLTVPLPEETICDELRARGLAFVGAVGIIDGVPRTALEIPLDEAAISLLAAIIHGT